MRVVELGEAAQNGRGVARLLLPIARSPIGFRLRIDEHHGLFAGKVGNVRGPGNAHEIGMLLRELDQSFLVSLIGGQPEILAK